MNEINMKPENKPNLNLSETDNSEQQRKAAVERFKTLKDKAPTKQPFFKKTGVRVAGAVLAVSALLGGTAYELASHGIIDVPGIHQKIEVLSTFDNNPPMHTVKNNDTGEIYYESDPIIIKAGVNATPATPEDIKDFQNQTPPIYKETPIGEHSPYINVMLPIDPIDVESIQITKSTFDTNRGNHNFPYFYIDEWQISIKGNGALPIPLVEGATKVTAKVAMDTADTSRISNIDLTYQLNDGRTIKGFLTFESDNPILTTDILKSIPSYVPGKDSDIQGKEFDLSQNPRVPLFNFSGSTSIWFSLGTGQPGGGLSPVFKTNNGELLYSSATP